ncbi:gag-pol polyprotein [Tanacetum coccineum]|uniref:Gag-pol polyprotein n=1 Tax=Tanacetum coccineum TaxID=301880 RepID=A0ABQ4WUN8_9ASTR
MVGGNGGNRFRQYARQNARNQVGYNTRQVAGNQNGYNAVQNVKNQGNGNGNNSNQIRCYNYRGLGHYAKNCIVRLRGRDFAYLHTQLLIAQKEEAGIQLQAKEFDLMAAAGDIDKIEEVNANCILMANLQQASTSGTHVYLRRAVY